MEPQEFIRFAAPGTMVHCVAHVPEAEFALLVREKQERVAALQLDQLVLLQCGLAYWEDILLFPILLGVGGRLYTTWLNPQEEEQALTVLSQREYLFILFFTPEPYEEMIRLENGAQEAAKDALEMRKRYLPCSKADFERARREFCRRFPTPELLGRFLTEDNSQKERIDFWKRLWE